MKKNFFYPPQIKENWEDIIPLRLERKEFKEKILQEIYASTELNRVLNWQLDDGYRFECCFLVDGVVKFILYHHNFLVEEEVWAIASDDELFEILSPKKIILKYLRRYYYN